jgi:hypothetical protein
LVAKLTECVSLRKSTTSKVAFAGVGDYLNEQELKESTRAKSTLRIP